MNYDQLGLHCLKVLVYCLTTADKSANFKNINVKLIEWHAILCIYL